MPDMVQYHGRIESRATLQWEPQITHLTYYFLNVIFSMLHLTTKGTCLAIKTLIGYLDTNVNYIQVTTSWQRHYYRVWQKNLMIFKLQCNEKYTIFLCEFITKIIFMSKHFNYNINFLNIVHVRWWALLSAHSRKWRTSDKSLTQSFDVLKSSKWRLSSWRFSFCGRRCFSEVSHP